MEHKFGTQGGRQVNGSEIEKVLTAAGDQDPGKQIWQ